MKSSDILAALKADPEAAFAFRPTAADRLAWEPTFVRGLSRAGTNRHWRYSEWRKGDGQWVKNSDGWRFVSSRDLISLEQVEIELTLRRADHEQRLTRFNRAETVVSRLAELGVKARHRGDVVEVLDAEALGRALCRVE